MASKNLQEKLENKCVFYHPFQIEIIEDFYVYRFMNFLAEVEASFWRQMNLRKHRQKLVKLEVASLAGVIRLNITANTCAVLARSNSGSRLITPRGCGSESSIVMQPRSFPSQHTEDRRAPGS